METFNFKRDVLDRSFEIPVVVDFWAPWCGPCRVLGPTIEQLADEQEGRWELVKLNTEDFPEVAEQYQVMSIPNVKLFRNGRPAAEFVGALPRKQIEQWLDQHIPSGEKLQLASILSQVRDFPDQHAAQVLETFVADNPGVAEGRVELAKHLVFEAPLRALTLLEDISLGHDRFDEAEDIRALAHFLDSPLQEDLPVARALREAREALKAAQPERGIEQIIQAVQTDKNFQEDLPRKTAIALFHLLGDQHPLTRAYRWKFDMALY
jgi:putative thioredoxin